MPRTLGYLNLKYCLNECKTETKSAEFFPSVNNLNPYEACL